MTFLSVVFFHNNLHFIINQDSFLSIHIILEFFSVAVSFSIAMQGWLTFPHTLSKHRLLLGAVFLAVGSLDLMHTLSFKGMPFFLTESSVAKATWFWISARLTEAICLGIIFIRPDSTVHSKKWRMVFLSFFLYSLATAFPIIYWSDNLPPLVVEGHGVTNLKVAFEYLISFLHLFTISFIVYRYKQERQNTQLILISALVFILLGELIFTLYRNVYDLYTMLGHVYKALGYFFLLKSLYVTTVEEPFVRERSTAKRLKHTQNTLNRFFNLSLDMLCIVDFDGYFKQVNPVCENILGYKKEELVGKPLKDLIHPEDLAKSMNEIQKIIATGNPTIKFENRILCKDKTFKYFEWVAVPDIDEGLTYAVARNITERKRIEESLRESEERFRNAFDYASIGMALVALDGQWLQVNHSTSNILGYAEEELKEITFHTNTHPEDLATDVSNIEKLLAGEIISYQMEKRYYHKLGHTVWCLLSVSLVRDSKVKPLYFIAQIQDITARKQLEDEIRQHHDQLEKLVKERTEELVSANKKLELEIIERKHGEREINKLNQHLKRRALELDAKNKELESFSYSVSHDLRAPLRGINGFSQALMEDYYKQLDETGKNYLQRICAASQRMGQLIDDLLNLSHVTRNKISFEEVDLSSLAQQIFVELQSTEPERQVEFLITHDIVAKGDTRLLRIALENLLSNAWKFSSNETKSIMEFGISPNKDKPIYFVRDNGAGFDMAYYNKLFGSFQRLHDMSEFPGTGIGLATVRRIINRHGGRIWAEGAVEQGATFYFTLNETEL